MLDYPNEVNNVFLKKHGDEKFTSNAHKMNTQYNIAKTLLSEEYSDLMDELKKKAHEQHEVEINKWNLALTDVSAAQDVSLWVTTIISIPR